MRSRPSSISFKNIEDLLLADVAVRIQLSPTSYQTAVDRYRAINDFVDREGSPLAGRIHLFYPQGSMAIGATIASRLTTDEFDVDIIAQLLLDATADPARVLDLLYEAINGPPGSRYHGSVERCSRCITVSYADGMHVDVTPMVRRLGTPERESILFHHRRENRRDPGYRKIANPFGFAEWFKKRTPQEILFAEEYAALTKSHIALAEAEQDPMPEREDLYRKSMALIALQLLKRYRNVRYDQRDVRRPPSVVLSKLVADNSGKTARLSEELLYQSERAQALLQECASSGSLLEVTNPTCNEDILTDRWPMTQSEQQVFIKDLQYLIRQLVRLRAGCPLEELRNILADLFGERPSADAVTALAENLGDRIISGRGLYVPSSIKSSGSAALLGLSGAAGGQTRPTPPHRFFGN